MKVSGQLQSLATFSPLLTEQEAGWAPESVCTFWRSEKIEKCIGNIREFVLDYVILVAVPNQRQLRVIFNALILRNIASSSLYTNYHHLKFNVLQLIEIFFFQMRLICGEFAHFFWVQNMLYFSSFTEVFARKSILEKQI